MMTWYFSAITFHGTPDHFRSASAEWLANGQWLRAKDLDILDDGDGLSSAYFLTAEKPDCCFARFLSSVLPTGPVNLEFFATEEGRRLFAAYLDGQCVEIEAYNHRELIRWSRDRGLFEEFVVDYDVVEHRHVWKLDTELLVSATPRPEICPDRAFRSGSSATESSTSCSGRGRGTAVEEGCGTDVKRVR